MNNITQYITEKLKLDKNIKLSNHESDYNTVVSLMTDICNINLKDKNTTELINSFERWVKYYDVNSINKVKCCIANTGQWSSPKLESHIKRNNLNKFISYIGNKLFRNYYNEIILNTKNVNYLLAEYSGDKSKGSTYLSSDFENNLIYFQNYDGVNMIIFKCKK